MSDTPMVAALPLRKVKGYGWHPDLPDQRDLMVSDLPRMQRVPRGTRKFSLREKFPEGPYDQSQLGSCVGNGVTGVVQFERAKQGLAPFRPSRLAIYYGARLIEGTVGSDSGAFIRDGIKVVAKTGAGPEDLWPYDISKFTSPPPPEYMAAAEKDQALKYARLLPNLTSVKTCIYNGFPVVFGFSVYSSFEGSQNMQTGLMPMPAQGEEVVGGHCVVWMGWDDDLAIPGPRPVTGALETRNSWGINVHDHGYFWMPTAFAVGGDCSDLWTIRLMESA